MFKCKVCGELAESVNPEQKHQEICDRCYSEWNESEKSCNVYIENGGD